MAVEFCSSYKTPLILLLVFINYVAAISSIFKSQFIKDPESLVSADNSFKLGFFSPENSSNRFAAIWYNQIPVITPIWIANRNNPLTDSSGIIKLSETGNLLVLNGQNRILWSTNVSFQAQNSTTKLKNNGNLVLYDSIDGNRLWESFQDPLNILSRKMSLDSNKNTGEKRVLTSWKSTSDPSTGSFSLGIDPLPIPQAFIKHGSHLYWRSGPWNGKTFIGIPFMNPDAFTLSSADSTGLTSLDFNYVNESVLYNYVLSPDGQFSQRNWVNNSWVVTDWFTPQTQCDVYGTCGAFGVCSPKSSQICSCLRGFEPKNPGNWSHGCVRISSLQCGVLQNGSGKGKLDGFSKLEKVKAPDFSEWSSSSELECEENCLSDCNCSAYSYYRDFGCLTWTGDLIDIQKFSSGGADLYFKVANSEHVADEKRNENIIVIVSITVAGGVFVVFVCTFLVWRMAKLKARKTKRMEMSFDRKQNQNRATISDANRLQELPVFDLKILASATDDFDFKNKLGQGGFGPVYKGKLTSGQEIAVKRLSRASGQGHEEFVNEVEVISKLQHRNLVRLFGCCVEGVEKMLVYEYMPNKSLDAFLFDPSKKELLNWRKRFNIVEGICRGLLYLHRDSRLRIIHRDLKPSNILLDQELNPKISDFGMARIFGGNENQADTKRIVGTYGYMSPEYAMEGRFSEKSDVFSLGVLLLEIASGRRNTSFYESDESLSLLGYAWKLMNEGNIEGLIDEVLLSDPSSKEEIIRCIKVGMLCVQGFAKDRPDSSTVVSMLKSEIAELPTPKQPAFCEAQIDFDLDGSQRTQNRNCSVNLVTITDVEVR